MFIVEKMIIVVWKIEEKGKGISSSLYTSWLSKIVITARKMVPCTLCKISCN